MGQHRMFIGVALPTLAGVPYYFHVPTRVFALAFCPLWLFVWLYFHYSVGFINLPCIMFAVILCVIFAYGHQLIMQDRWQHWQTTRALEDERRLLVEAQEALHRILSGLWDASCTCNAHGSISS